MPLNYLPDGTFTLPTGLFIHLINTLSTLDGYDEELCNISSGLRETQTRHRNGPASEDCTSDMPLAEGRQNHNFVFVDDELFRESLKEVLRRLADEQGAEYKALQREYSEAGGIVELRSLQKIIGALMTSSTYDQHEDEAVDTPRPSEGRQSNPYLTYVVNNNGIALIDLSHHGVLSSVNCSCKQQTAIGKE